MCCSPWNQGPPKNYIEVSHYIHSAEYWQDWIYTSFFHGGFILGLHTLSDQYKVIYDDLAENHHMYSSTNKIQDGKIFFSRWSAVDTFLRQTNRSHQITIESGYYSISEDSFVVNHTLAGPDAIHYTDISPDGSTVLVVEMSQVPVAGMPLDAQFDVLPVKE